MSDGAGGRRGVYSIGAVARMLGLSVATIRNWEERYAAVVPQRSPGGQRLYSRDDVEHLRFVAAQVASGLSAADAHRLLVDGRAGVSPSPSGEPDARVRPLVLIAERDRAAAGLAESALRGAGFDVEVVYDAGAAERRWIERGPPVAIVELLISGGEGTDLCRRLKRRGTGTVLASSALQAQGEARDAGADAFLQKPVDPALLVATVKDLLASRAAA